ncbi:hypothetical protein M413DRAFT_437787 [Hebeloma cylindrosporum]|uniref:Uncharacterized protein n=1 Tax=Hebeloma cylindrosporum TaxID=76867 RepID=A0A0C3CXN4_HEBCY|nr:hypothetical protein M413DRAFT_437787 [Hebeloma cylindrosporum h7]
MREYGGSCAISMQDGYGFPPRGWSSLCIHPLTSRSFVCSSPFDTELIHSSYFDIHPRLQRFGSRERRKGFIQISALGTDF